MRIASIRRFNVCTTVKRTKERKNKLLRVTNAKRGDISGRKMTVRVARRRDTLAVIRILEFIFSLLCSGAGKNRNNPLLNPSKLSVDNNVNNEYNDVAIPIWAVL